MPPQPTRMGAGARPQAGGNRVALANALDPRATARIMAMRQPNRGQQAAMAAGNTGGLGPTPSFNQGAAPAPMANPNLAQYAPGALPPIPQVGGGTAGLPPVSAPGMVLPPGPGGYPNGVPSDTPIPGQPIYPGGPILPGAPPNPNMPLPVQMPGFPPPPPGGYPPPTPRPMPPGMPGPPTGGLPVPMDPRLAGAPGPQGLPGGGGVGGWPAGTGMPSPYPISTQTGGLRPTQGNPAARYGR